MSDDLVKLLRRPYGSLTFAEKKEAADRIEELEEALRQIRDIALLSEGVEFYAMLAEKALKGEK